MLSLFRKKIGGAIKYYDLSDWWLTSFTDIERKRVLTVFTDKNFIEGDVDFLGGSPAGYLFPIASWFKTTQDRNIAYKFLDKAEALSSKELVLEKHFLYQTKIEVYYRFRNDDNFALAKAIEACEQQILLSQQAVLAFRKEYKDDVLPSHTGYTQLAIIREKEGKFVDAIRLSKDALAQGWGGDWESRIKRYEDKLKKQKI